MWRRLLFISCSVCLFAALSFYFVKTWHKSKRLNIILITTERVSYDRLSATNYPHLFSAARSGVIFQGHRAISGQSETNIVSLLTGLTPFESGVHSKDQSVDSNHILPLEQLEEKGYAVAGLQEFMRSVSFQNTGLTIPATGLDLQFWLAQKHKKGLPFFLWEHFASNPHNSSAENFDKWFQGLWEFLNKSGLLQQTILILTADQGDGQHIRDTFAQTPASKKNELSEKNVRIPLFIWLPERQNSYKRGSVQRQPSSHIDIIPTLFSILNIDPHYPLKGRDLFPERLSDQSLSWSAMTVSKNYAQKNLHYSDAFLYGYMEPPWKLLLKQSKNIETVWLYNIDSDPDEKENIASIHPKKVTQLTRALKKQIALEVTGPSRPNDPPFLKKITHAPFWIFPEKNTAYAYEDLARPFVLEWSGNKDAQYILHYQAGARDNFFEGELKVFGTRKYIGRISKKHWEKYLLPHSPFRVRVKMANSDTWSQWIELEAKK